MSQKRRRDSEGCSSRRLSGWDRFDNSDKCLPQTKKTGRFTAVAGSYPCSSYHPDDRYFENKDGMSGKLEEGNLVEEHLQIPDQNMGRVVGKNGSNILRLRNCYGVNTSDNKTVNREGNRTLLVSGPEHCVEGFKKELKQLFYSSGINHEKFTKNWPSIPKKPSLMDLRHSSPQSHTSHSGEPGVSAGRSVRATSRSTPKSDRVSSESTSRRARVSSGSGRHSEQSLVSYKRAGKPASDNEDEDDDIQVVGNPIPPPLPAHPAVRGFPAGCSSRPVSGTSQQGEVGEAHRRTGLILAGIPEQLWDGGWRGKQLEERNSEQRDGEWRVQQLEERNSEQRDGGWRVQQLEERNSEQRDGEWRVQQLEERNSEQRDGEWRGKQLEERNSEQRDGGWRGKQLEERNSEQRDGEWRVQQLEERNSEQRDGEWRVQQLEERNTEKRNSYLLDLYARSDQSQLLKLQLIDTVESREAYKVDNTRLLDKLGALLDRTDSLLVENSQLRQQLEAAENLATAANRQLQELQQDREYEIKQENIRQIQMKVMQTKMEELEELNSNLERQLRKKREEGEKRRPIH